MPNGQNSSFSLAMTGTGTQFGKVESKLNHQSQLVPIDSCGFCAFHFATSQDPGIPVLSLGLSLIFSSSSAFFATKAASLKPQGCVCVCECVFVCLLVCWFVCLFVCLFVC